ncbi:cyclic AMP-dependent transcription factor ATF-6 beta isoform X9 [Pongo abelii]|uniref:cyclic AMP-dependent transcription factor ATF-6 beta isoform X9 n=1 Tax=Pongo abelii TaxID=9601 RepID=UPI0030056E87
MVDLNTGYYISQALYHWNLFGACAWRSGTVWKLLPAAVLPLGPPTQSSASVDSRAQHPDSTLYSGLDEVAEEQTQLFRCPEQDVPFDGSSLDVGMDVSPPEPPWELLPIFPDLQVKSEPSSPCSSSSLSSESSRLSTEPSSEALGVGEVLHVKTESLAPPLCLLGDDPTSSFETVQINVVPTSDDSSDVQTKIEPVSPCSSINSEASLLSADSSSQAFIGEEVLEVKTESLSPSGCLLWDVPAPSLGAVQISMGPSPDGSSGKALPTRKPPLQPKPVVLTTVPVPPRAVPPSTTVLLQPLVQPPPVSPVVLIQGAIRVQPEGPAPSLPRPERKSIVPAPMPGNSCPPEVDAKLLKRQQRMIKNRESACQSRRKKKEYLQGLEARLQAVLADNQQLRRENAALRRRLEALLAENSELKLGSGNRKVVCIMVFLLFIAFNFGPVSISEPPSAPISPWMNKGEPQPRRHLLGFSEQEPVHGVEPLQGSSQGPKEPQPSPTDQPSFRLADELSGWVQRHQRGRRKIPQRAQERQSLDTSPSRSLSHGRSHLQLRQSPSNPLDPRKGILWASCNCIATQTVRSQRSWMQLTDGKTRFMLSLSEGTTCCSQPSATTRPPGPRCPW